MNGSLYLFAGTSSRCYSNSLDYLMLSLQSFHQILQFHSWNLEESSVTNPVAADVK